MTSNSARPPTQVQHNHADGATRPGFDAFHSLMVLSDSALPLGSFAFSSGLESCMAHQPRAARTTGAALFKDFLRLSIQSVASAALPYVTAGHQRPDLLRRLDNDLDASTSCTVARRASLAQGRALLTMWNRSIKANIVSSISHSRVACEALSEFSRALRFSNDDAESVAAYSTSESGLGGHLAPLFGALAAAMSLDLSETIYLFLLNHAKTLLSAGIRASLIGPYQSQGLLVSHWLRDLIRSRADAELREPIPVEEAGQTVPILDIWTGRHEIIYSRIFNS